MQLTQSTIQGFCAVPPVLPSLGAAQQSLLQSQHPVLHLCFTVRSQEVAVAVLHLQFKAITAHLLALKGSNENFYLNSFSRVLELTPHTDTLDFPIISAKLNRD